MGRVLCWLFGIVFIIIAALNVVLVHPVPGIFYFVLSLAYFPLADRLTKRRLGFTIPIVAKIIIALVILWGTLAVGDLAEILGL